VVVYRYSQLLKFHKKVKDRFKANKLPQFPPSSYWKNHVSVVDKRKVELTAYLNAFVRQVDLLRDDDCCSFFRINETRSYLLEIQTLCKFKNKMQLPVAPTASALLGKDSESTFVREDTNTPLQEI